jgi:hypothetical protein
MAVKFLNGVDVTSLKYGTTTTAGNVLTSDASGNVTLQVPSSVSFPWTNVTTTTQAASVNNGYIANNAALVTITLPVTVAVGGIISVAGAGAGGWKIAQNASQVVNFGNRATTSGIGGSLTSANQFDAVKLICITANLTFSVVSSNGNVTIV